MGLTTSFSISENTITLINDKEVTKKYLLSFKNICKKLDIKLNRKKSSSDLIDFVDDRFGHDYRYSIDSSYIRKKLKWYPKTNLDVGLDQTIDWYLNNLTWKNNTEF